MSNVSMPEQDTLTSKWLPYREMYMKQVNKQIQRVCKLPSVPSFSSINYKLGRCHAERWFTGFPLKKSCEKVTKWEIFLLGQGKKTVHRTDQPSAQKDSLGKSTEHVRQNVQECFCQMGLPQNLVHFFECLIISTGAALHTHTCCVYFSVRSHKYLQV